jgi:hypothetical protein
MIKLITILANLKDAPRQLTDEENLFLYQLGEELHRADNDAARWRILQREGLNRLDGFNFDDAVLDKLAELRRGAMN